MMRNKRNKEISFRWKVEWHPNDGTKNYHRYKLRWCHNNEK